MPNALLVGPKNPITFWSFDESLRFIDKKCAFPPLGLLTIAGMIPDRYDLRLVDLNVRGLHDEDLAWADCVITSSMIIHWSSLEEVIARCNRAKIPILCGGPLPTQYHEEIEGEAIFYLGEAENGFLDLVDRMVQQGSAAGRETVDRRRQFRALQETPLPRWDLIDPRHYTDMLVQITRGCPEACTFCNIPALYGSETRLKEGSQTIRELQALYNIGWRGSVMAVDDNFIGNRDSILDILRNDVVPWQKERDYPFQFYTQASIRMSEDPPLIEAMHEAGFDQVFVGIESPVKESLKFMGAQKNLKGDKSLLDKVKTLQSYGFEVSAGFIVGLDTDPEDVAEQMIDFIQEAAVPVSMVGILGVLRDTPDYKRFERAGRLVKGVKYSGDSGLFRKELSFVPAIDPEELFRRHRTIVSTIYRPRYYFARVRTLVGRLGKYPRSPRAVRWTELKGALRSAWRQGICSHYRRQYWRMLLSVFFTDPRRFPMAVRMAIQGHHMITITEQALRTAKIQSFYEDALKAFENFCRGARHAVQPRFHLHGGELLRSVGGRLKRAGSVAALRHNAEVFLQTARGEIRLLKREYRSQARRPFEEFKGKLEELLKRHRGAKVGAAPESYERGS